MSAERAEESLRALRREVEELVARVPGPLRQVRAAVGECHIDLEWGESPGAAAPSATGARATRAEANVPMDDGLVAVEAPLVGTFYRCPAPGEKPFVEVGDSVLAGQQVGIVEAMKLMNAVYADCDGRVEVVHVDDSVMVEYGQALVSIAPDEEL
ncbi:biotin/lipoyl-containing protein [Saccharopolyspora sp. NPDC050389]|uniref:acetyl-CoA carboxylase biotin carboxyl carrier protein n=1 Tax=Saccharopolyspora sp. NPDC050389 TaxID=3155516 RepID=UPI0033E104B7